MLEVAVRRRLREFALDAAFSAGDEIVVLFGPSGAGKSVTLQTIAGVLRPDGGRILANGRALFDSAARVDLPPQRRRVGYVPQNYGLFPHLTVQENVAYGLQSPRDGRAERVRALLELMHLEGLAGRRPHELSGGQQQRVALARAMALRPDILLLDEPFAALDTAIRADLRDELIELQRRSGLTVVVVTHDLADAFLLGDRMAVLDAGRVLQQGTREEVFYRPASRRVAEFVGTRNILHGTILGGDDGALRIDWRGRTLLATPQSLPPGAEVDVTIRATQIMIVRKDQQVGPRDNRMRGHVVQEAVRAETHVLSLQLEGSDQHHDLEIELPGYVYYRLRLDREKDVEVHIRKEAVWVIGGQRPQAAPEAVPTGQGVVHDS